MTWDRGSADRITQSNLGHFFSFLIEFSIITFFHSSTESTAISLYLTLTLYPFSRFIPMAEQVFESTPGKFRSGLEGGRGYGSGDRDRDRGGLLKRELGGV